MRLPSRKKTISLWPRGGSRGEHGMGNSCELANRFSAKRGGWRASGHVVCALLPAEEASGKRTKMPVLALIGGNSKGGLVHVHPNQLLGEWKERSIDTQKMAMQVEPRWAIWVEYQRNQSQMELLRFGHFRFSEICVRSNTSKIRMNIAHNFYSRFVSARDPRRESPRRESPMPEARGPRRESPRSEVRGPRLRRERPVTVQGLCHTRSGQQILPGIHLVLVMMAH